MDFRKEKRRMKNIRVWPEIYFGNMEMHKTNILARGVSRELDAENWLKGKHKLNLV